MKIKIVDTVVRIWYSVENSFKEPAMFTLSVLVSIISMIGLVLIVLGITDGAYSCFTADGNR